MSTTRLNKFCGAATGETPRDEDQQIQTDDQDGKPAMGLHYVNGALRKVPPPRITTWSASVTSATPRPRSGG